MLVYALGLGVSCLVSGGLNLRMSCEGLTTRGCGFVTTAWPSAPVTAVTRARTWVVDSIFAYRLSEKELGKAGQSSEVKSLHSKISGHVGGS